MDTPEEMSQIEHIRFRASMYIGRLGDGTYPHDGIYTLLREVLHYIVNEFWEGYGNGLKSELKISKLLSFAIMAEACPLRNAMQIVGNILK